MPALPRRAAALVAALALATLIPSPGLADYEDVKETAKSTFTLLPHEGRVQARAVVTLVNRKKPAVSRGPCAGNPRRTCRNTTRYFINRWGTIVTPPDASNVVIGGRNVGSTSLGSGIYGSAWVASFPDLHYKKKQVIEVAFDLVDAEPGPRSRTRVTEAYAHFCWYPEVGDTGTARASLPRGWTAHSVGSKVTAATTAGGTTIRLASGKAPASQMVCTDAFRSEAMTPTHVFAPGGQLITLLAWPDDPTWSPQMRVIIEDGLPALEQTIGSAMPFAALTVQEVARTNAFGRPSDVDVSQSRLLMDEKLDFEAAPLSTFARTWFSDGSIEEPWLAEGLALWAGLTAAGLACPEPGEYPSEGQPNLRQWLVFEVPSFVPPDLPAWQALAACTIVEAAADAVGPARMHQVIGSLRAGTPRYGGGIEQGRSTQPADWTDWLDAVDELGLVPAGVTDLELAERTLVAYGVASPEDLAGRSPARRLYHETIAGMDGAALPAYVDGLMEAWSFDEAIDAIAESKRLHDRIADDPSMSDDTRAAFLAVFERAGSAEALAEIERAIGTAT